MAADRSALRRETAPAWGMMEAVVRGGQAYAPSFYVLLAVADLIGAVRLITNSQVLIVAAMVVGLEYNAITAVALGISRRDRGAVRNGPPDLLGGAGYRHPDRQPGRRARRCLMGCRVWPWVSVTGGTGGFTPLARARPGRSDAPAASRAGR